MPDLSGTTAQQATLAELLTDLIPDRVINRHVDGSMWLDGSARAWERLAEMDDLAIARLAHDAEAEAQDFANMDRILFAAWSVASPVAPSEPGAVASVWLHFAAFPKPLRGEICRGIAAALRDKATRANEIPLEPDL